MDNPNEDSIYLCGNSLGLQAKKSREYIDRELDKWAKVYVKEELKDFTFLKNSYPVFDFKRSFRTL